MANYFDDKYKEQSTGNYFDSKYAEVEQPAPPPVPERQETTWGEFAQGAVTDLGIGTMRATKAIPDTLSFVLPDAWTDPYSEFFERGIDAGEALKPESYKNEAQQTFREKDAFGKPTGEWQLPSAEAIVGTGIQSLPMIPFFLGGAGAAKGATTAANAALAARTGRIAKEAGKGAELVGFGGTNAAMVAPDQWRQTYKEALKEGKNEEEARAAADWAAWMTAQLSFTTGITGGGVAQKLGATSGSLPAAVAKGFAGEAPFEGIEESGQNIIGDLALGKQPDLPEAMDVGLTGAAAGGAPGAAFSGLSHITDSNQKSLGDLAKEIIEAESNQEPPPPPAPRVEETPPTIVGQGTVAQAMKEAERLAAEQARARIEERRNPPAPEKSAPVREIEEVEQDQAPVQERMEPEPTPDQVEFERNYNETKEVAEYEPVEVPPRPNTLLEKLANERIRLDRNKFGGELAEQVRIGNKWLLEGKKSGYEGMGPDDLVTFLIENKFMNEPPADQPTNVTTNDALDILQAAIRGEEVRSLDDDVSWQKHDEAIRFNDEIARAQFELQILEEEKTAVEDQLDALDAIRFGENSDPNMTDEEWADSLEQRWAEYERTAQEEIENVDERPIQETSEPGTLIPEATPQETIKAAIEAKDSDRNRLGEDEVPVEQGEGELFAGNTPGQRPEQLDLTEQTDETADEPQAVDDGTPEKIEDNTASPEYVEKALQGVEFTEKKLKLLSQIYPFDPNDLVDKNDPAYRDDILAHINGTEEEIDLIAKQLRSGRNLIARRDPKTNKMVHPNKRVREMLTEELNTPEAIAEWEKFGIDDEARRILNESDVESKERIWPEPEETRNIEAEVGKEYLSEEEVTAELTEWENYVENVSKTEDHSNDVVLSLYDFTGNWASPWAHGGYDVQLFDIKSGFDLVRDVSDLISHIEMLKNNGKNIVTVLAAPPCETFTISSTWAWEKMHDNINTAEVFRRYGTWASKHFQSPLEYAETMVQIVELVIDMAGPQVWAMENPAVGRIKTRLSLPEPVLTFNPNNFGENYTKRTALWGNMSAELPTANANPSAGSKMQAQMSAADKEARQETPKSFAYSFFVAQHRAMTANKEQKPKLQQKADEARARLKAKAGTLNSGVDPRDLADLAIIGADYVNQGVKTFKDFSKRMIDEFGDWVKPHLQDVWKKVAPPEEKKKPPKKVKRHGRETSTKNAVTQEERDARNADQIFFSFRESNEELVDRAEQELKNNPDVADEIINRLNTQADPSISRLDLAILMVHKTDVRQAARKAAEKMLNPDLNPEQRAVATANYEDAMLANEEIDLAATVAGAVWGGWGQLRSKFMQEDYSLESQLAVTAALLGKPPTEKQAAFIRELTERVAALEEKLKRNEETKQQIIEKRVAQEVMRQLGKQMDRDAKKQQPTVRKKLRDKRKSLQDEIKADFLRLNSTPVDLMVKIAKLGGILMAEGAVEFAAWTDALTKSLGSRIYNRIKEDIDAIYAMAQDEYHAISDLEKADASGEFRLASASNQKQELLIEAEALSQAGEGLTHKLVYQLAQLYVESGMRGEAEVMAAVHADLSTVFPDIDERTVRRLFTEYGKAKFPSEEEDKVHLRELRTLVRLQESIDRLKEKKAPLRTGPQRDKATQKIREKQKILNEMMRRMEMNRPDPSRRSLASINEQRIRRLENSIKDLQNEIDTGEKRKKGEPVPDSPEVKKLKKKRDVLKARLAEIEAAKKPQLTEEEKYNAMRGKQLRNQLKEVQARLRNKDYAPRHRKQMPELSKENRDLKDQVQQAKMELGDKQLAWQRSHYTWRQKVWDGIAQMTSLIRAVKTSYDLSAVLRQGGFYVLSHPFVAIKSFVPMIKALGGDKFAREVNDEILNRPNAHLYRKAKLFLAEQDSAHPTKMEEVYMSRWQRKVPGVAASGRAYVTFLNKLRADVFDSTYEAITRDGERPLTEEELLDLGDFINNATGRADLGRFNSEGISTLFFAPRWVASRFNMMAYPLKATGLVAGRSGKAMSNRMKRRVAREYFQFISGFSILWMLTAMMFEDDDDENPVIQWDPRSTDFGKVRTGDTRLDVTSGMSNAIVFTSRMLSQQAMSQRGEIRDLRVVGDGGNVSFGSDTTAGVIGRFLRSKLAPIPSTVINLVDGENVVGESYKEGARFMRDEMGVPAEIAENPFLQEMVGFGVPLSVADFYDAAEAEGIPKAAALQILATLGISMNTYATEPKKKKGNKKGRPKTSRPKRPSRPSRG